MESLTTYNFIGRAVWGEVGAQSGMGSQPHLTLCSNLAPCCVPGCMKSTGDESGRIRFLEPSILFFKLPDNSK